MIPFWQVKATRALFLQFLRSALCTNENQSLTCLPSILPAVWGFSGFTECGLCTEMLCTPVWKAWINCPVQSKQFWWPRFPFNFPLRLDIDACWILRHENEFLFQSLSKKTTGNLIFSEIKWDTDALAHVDIRFVTSQDKTTLLTFSSTPSKHQNDNFLVFNVCFSLFLSMLS